VISRAHPPDVAFSAARSSAAVNATGSPVFRGIVERNVADGATSIPDA